MDNKKEEHREWSKDEMKLWQLMDNFEAPQPREEVRHRFYSMLDTMKQEHTFSRTTWQHKLFALLSNNIYRVAYSLALIMVGSLTTYFFTSYNNFANNEQQNVYHLKAEINELREMMMFSLLQNPIATERMKAVNYSKEFEQPDDKILNALITTFKEDSNDNVRLVALNALILRADWPQVRKTLIEALVVEKSPLIQAALADAMIKMQEKKSIDQLKKRLAQEELNAFVKQKFAKTIEKLSL